MILREEGLGKKTMTRHLVSVSDLNEQEIEDLLALGRELKRTFRSRESGAPLAGKTLAMIFEKPSLRTRVTFEAGMTQLGGHAIHLQNMDIGLGARESVPDAARNLERWVDGIAARTFAHSTVTELARCAHIPVINALTDRLHPCQALAFLLTLTEHRPDVRGLRLAFIGDGNNVAHSLILLSAKVGMEFAIACPEGYEPDADIIAEGRGGGASIEILRRSQDAVRDADLIYTDVWTSMGQEAEAERRRALFSDYRVDRALLELAKPDCLVSHCLPAHRGEEITDDVLDGPHSIAFDEAENRLHIQKAILVKLMS